MEKERFLVYWQSYLAGTATPAEVQELLAFIRTPAADLFLEEYFQTSGVAGFRAADLAEADWQLNWAGINASISQQQEVAKALPTRRFPAMLRWAAAAALAGIIATAFFFYPTGTKKKMASAELAQAPDIPPGKEGAVLTLADGSQLVLDSLKSGVIGAQQNVAISLADGQLTYQQKEPAASNSPAAIYNTISTPRGRQFRLLLPDGSRVWLNASSSIRYPVQFTGPKRKVEITGEAYFEIAANSARPFEVVGEGQQVEVLGTSFNINLYSDEPVKKTTLVSGAVKVSAGESAVLLKPGQEAVSAGTSLQLQQASGGATDWKDNIFNFHHASLPEVMRQLERWYDIEVSYPDGIPAIEFWGKTGRDMNLSQMISFLERSDVHCRLEPGNKLVVQNNPK
ncbi:MAG: FecR domain-containing protein [Candidatus Pseudobacter hemicellulosilyticus]|uniref:FecR domain-containing protein n=1 Tax=Candidatus Pseudobacter hemicellulosilyticus TaxID=3121375 RepID=A0AAJ5WTL8_9BACT|nr:MAG: FecR domain-containing protein [Pseudobacter sp.]